MITWRGGVATAFCPGSGTVLYSDLWTKDECQLHINVLELRVVRLTLLHLEQDILDQTILIES